MIALGSVEYLKIAGYIISGFAVARAWFAKEITYGKKLIALLEDKAKKAEAAIATEVKKL